MRYLVVFASLVLVPCGIGFAQEERPQPDQIFGTSLHHTSRGLAYWYSEKQGGLGRLTGLPISEFGCTRCHIDSCETCHLEQAGGIRRYSRNKARSPETCGKCHGFADVEATRKRGGIVDVHFEKGMVCMDCHTSGDVHGDGRAYNTLRDEGAIDARCDKCHDKLTAIPSHGVHGAKLGCAACHVKDRPSCHNCHVETRLKEGKSVSIPMNDVVFLVNATGQVNLAVCLTFIYNDKTMVEFAPSFRHAVVRQGRTCKDCHATSVVADIRSGQFSPGRYENGEFRSVSGVVPVVDGMRWPFVFFNRENGRWVPDRNALPPVIHYSGYSSPLTSEQLKKLLIAH
jgi:hypothetical protein